MSVTTVRRNRTVRVEVLGVSLGSVREFNIH